MPPATAAAIAAAPLLDPSPGTVHVLDMHRDTANLECRLSDHAFGMVWYGLIESTITQTDVCDFHMVFQPHLVIRANRVHEGTAFTGPDGLVVQIRGEWYDGGDANLPRSPLTTSQIITHRNYATWVATLLWRGRTFIDSDHHQGIMSRTIRRPPGTSSAVTSPATTKASGTPPLPPITIGTSSDEAVEKEVIWDIDE